MHFCLIYHTNMLKYAKMSQFKNTGEIEAKVNPRHFVENDSITVIVW